MQRHKHQRQFRERDGERLRFRERWKNGWGMGSKKKKKFIYSLLLLKEKNKGYPCPCFLRWIWPLETQPYFSHIELLFVRVVNFSSPSLSHLLPSTPMTLETHSLQLGWLGKTFARPHGFRTCALAGLDASPVTIMGSASTACKKSMCIYFPPLQENSSG